MKILILTCTSSEVGIKDGNNENFPRVAEISWIVVDEFFNVLKIEKQNYIFPDENFKRVSASARAVNGLNIDFLRKNGKDLKDVLEKLYSDIVMSDYVVGYDIWAMKKLISWEYEKCMKNKKLDSVFASTNQIDILDVARPLVKAKYSDIKSGIKRPSLKQVVNKLTNEDIKDNSYDENTINYVLKCFIILCKIGMITL